MRRRARPLLAAGLLLSGTSLIFAPDRTVIQIQPGSRVMSAAEIALAPDPSAGAQHGVVLIEETDRDDTAGSDCHLTYHFRAKVLSAEGRELGNVEIPIDRERGVLKKWWGWTILPDGTVRELRQEELVPHEVARSQGAKLITLKGVLPGIVPGSIIDYGWIIWTPEFPGWDRVQLQRSWPMKELRYRWVPWEGRAAAFRLSRVEGLAVEAVHNQRAVLVSGRNLPSAVEEPWMPPKSNSAASVTFYYRLSGHNPKEFWELEAKRMDRRLAGFCREKPVRQAITSMGMPSGADLTARLMTAYRWTAENIRSTHFQTAEEAEAEEEDEDEVMPTRRTANEILTDRAGNHRELAFLYACFARELGADAWVVMATDRTELLFDAGLLSTFQFDWTLAFIRAPGDPDERGIFVDCGLGLPYGEVAWWAAGGPAFLCDPKNPRSVMVRTSQPGKSISDTSTRIEFEPGDESAAVRWTRSGSGQNGLSERLAARRKTPEERRDWLEEACGAAADFEIQRAEAPDLADLNRGFHLECEGRMLDTNLTPDLGSYSFSFTGPWIEWVPELTAANRVHPVVFEYPRIDQNVIDIRSPAGFAPAKPPPVPPVESPFGHYALFLTAAPEGFHVERIFALSALAIPPQDYDALRRFLAEVRRRDQTRLEFVREESRP